MPVAVTPKLAPVSRISGRIARGISNAASRSSSHSRRCRSNSIVRDALVTSVACTAPPVSRHSRKLSIVPNAISPASARCAQPGDRVEQPADFRRREIRVDDEAGATGDRLGVAGGAPCAAERLGAPVLPDDRVVHRAAGGALPQHRRLALVGDADRGDRLALRGDRSPPGRSPATARQISSGSCSTQPGCG